METNLRTEDEVTKIARIKRYLDNLNNDALKQIVVFLLSSKRNNKFVWKQIEEFNHMYEMQR